MAKRHVDKEKLSRADREAKAAIQTEQEARNAKTARLRELRLQHEAEIVKPARTSLPHRASAKKPVARRVIEVD